MRHLMILSVALFCVACEAEDAAEMPAPEPAPNEVESKEDARALGKSDWSIDFCEFFGWYEDGVCDEFCPDPDPECGNVEDACFVDDDCANGGRCIAAACDPTSACPPNFCAPAEDECFEDADCANGGTCVAAACNPNGPCPANYCAPAEDQNECYEDADCGEGTCLIAACNPNGPCPPNECVPPAEPADECFEDAECPGAQVCSIAQCNPNGPCPPNTCVDRVCGTRGAPACGDGEYCFFDGDHCGRADQGGVCRAQPDFCTREVDPVCGCDGGTYSNACNAAAAGVSVEAAGACAEGE